MCCALYCLWARRLLYAAPDAWADAVATLRTIYGSTSPEYAELAEIFASTTRRKGRAAAM
ncbi:MAG: hypothetical protein U0074_02410 [Kouleothrix sp.]